MKKTIISIVLFTMFLAAPLIAKSEKGTLAEFCAAIGMKDTVSCVNSKLIKNFKCFSVGDAPDSWRRDLQPQYPMALCSYDHSSHIEGVTRTGCLEGTPNTLLVVKKDGSVVEIGDKREFASEFMPMQSANEALAYASIMTGAYPMNSFHKRFEMFGSKGKWLIRSPMRSFAEQKDDGWHVLLYRNDECGCHPIELFQVQYLIGIDGTVTKLKETKAWKANGEICVD